MAQMVARLRKRGQHQRATWDDGDMEFTAADMLTFLSDYNRRLLDENIAFFNEKASLAAENATLRHDNDIRRQNMSDTWQAMMAMRDSINEHVQLPSLESDLLQGPENSVFCEVVATAVIGELATLRAERDGIGDKRITETQTIPERICIMSTRAIYTFKDATTTHHVYKHHDGYPTGAQEALAAVAAQGKAWPMPRYESDDFAAGFVAANKGEGGGVRLALNRHSACDVQYGYTVEQKAGKPDVILTVSATNFWGDKPKETKLWRGKLSDFTAEVAAGI